MVARKQSFAHDRAGEFVALLDEQAAQIADRPRRGRPATGRKSIIGVRASDELHSAIDQWALGQIDPPTRSEAVRRLIVIALETERRRARTHRLRVAQGSEPDDAQAPDNIDRAS